MANVQRDYILHLTEELGAVLARLLEQFGLRRMPPEEVVQEAQTACGQFAVQWLVAKIFPPGRYSGTTARGLTRVAAAPPRSISPPNLCLLAGHPAPGDLCPHL